MTSNLPLKGIALLLALVVWAWIISGDKNIERLMTVPLQVVDPMQGIAIVTGLPDRIELYVRGPQSRVKAIENARQEGTLAAKLNLRHASIGKRKYPITIVGVNLRWMKYELNPGPKLEVECEKSSHKTFTPQREIVGGIEPGMFIESESGLPEKVIVEGAEALINQVTKVIYRLTETQLAGSDKVTVDFLPQDENGRQIPNVKVYPQRTELLITVRKASASREVPIVYNLIGHPPSGYTVTDVNIDPLFINLEGSSELLKGITRIETVPVDLTGRTKDFTIPDLGIITPKERIKLNKSTVYLEVKIARKTATRLVEGLPITWEGADTDTMYYVAEPRVVKVTVTGPMNVVDGLTAESIVPSVDVTGLVEGWHENLPVSVKIMLPDISLAKIEPDTVRVHIQKRDKTAPEKEGE